MCKRLALIVVAALAVIFGAAGSGIRSARATVAVAYELDGLVDLATLVVVARADERQSRWEQLAGSRRIVTYTKLTVLETVYRRRQAHAKPLAAIWVRSLGGVVGHIGQQVAGQATFRLGEPSLLFLVPAEGGTLTVAGAAQGHFPLRKPKGNGEAAARLGLSPAMALLVRKRHTRQTVQQALRGAALPQAIELIRATKKRRDAVRHAR